MGQLAESWIRDWRTRRTTSSMSLRASAACLLSIMVSSPGPCVGGNVVGDRRDGPGDADNAHVVDALDQLDVDRRRDRVYRVGVFVRQHQFIVGAGNQRQRLGHAGKIVLVAAGAGN